MRASAARASLAGDRLRLEKNGSFDYLAPLPRLLIFGGGPDIEPLAVCADQLGFMVRVIDPRPGFLSRRRLPASVQALPVSVERGARPGDIDEQTACVVATHSFSLDTIALDCVLRSRAGYIGVLGPKDRSKRLLHALAARSNVIGLGLERLHSPIGLDIGADTPEQVSLAILAEIQAVFAHRGGGFLREHSGPIHRDLRLDSDSSEGLCA
jgi:xanthine/CO dehydrogenase XdhC/CoxF family maturation factor